MPKIYGSMLCPDCVQCCEELTAAGISYEFCDFADSLVNLKTFLSIRDKNEVFPCIVDEKGNISLDWSSYVGQAEA